MSGNVASCYRNRLKLRMIDHLVRMRTIPYLTPLNQTIISYYND